MWCTLSLLAPNAITAISRGGELFAQRRVTVAASPKFPPNPGPNPNRARIRNLNPLLSPGKACCLCKHSLKYQYAYLSRV